jgi:16S rRNA C1402 (ribose-2'-O) methylase RsmI
VVVFFEAPHRIGRTLNDMRVHRVNRPIVLQRELTKIHEQLVDLSKSETGGGDELRGEFTIVVGPDISAPDDSADDATAADIFGRLTDQAGLSEEIALRIMDETFHLSPSSVRKALKRHSISVKRQNKPLA